MSRTLVALLNCVIGLIGLIKNNIMFAIIALTGTAASMIIPQVTSNIMQLVALTRTHSKDDVILVCLTGC